MKTLKLLLLLLLCSGIVAHAQKYYTTAEIPNPKSQGQDHFVSNPDGILSNVDTLTNLLVKLEKETKIEFAVVAVKDFDQQTEEFDFAYDLFNNWGIGKKNVDNGLLLFIAIDRRNYRFISGGGTEGLLPDVVLKQIGERFLVPAFKEQDYDNGVLNATNEIYNILTNPQHKAEVQFLVAESERKNNQWKFDFGYAGVILLAFLGIFKILNLQLPKLVKKQKALENGFDKVVGIGCAVIFFGVFFSIFVFAFVTGFGWLEKITLSDVPIILFVILSIILLLRYFSSLSRLRKFHQDDENFLKAANKFNKRNFWTVAFSPLVLIPIISQTVKSYKSQPRFTPLKDSHGNDMTRVDRDINFEGKPFLDPGQREEELIKVYDYDIWESSDKEEVNIKAWPAENYDDYSQCPKCNYKTFSKPLRKTIRAATYSSTGEAKEIKECEFCDHEEFIRNVTLAKLVKSSSSS
ncbi:MAG: TPM domain-containing protein, partial [Pedobacter sp.]